MKTIVFTVALLLCLASLSFAVQLTPDLNLGIHGVFGTHYSATYNDEDATQNLNISRDKNNWYGEAEIGLTIKDMVRPFVGYREANELFSIKEAGVDIMPIKGVPVGIRNSYQRYDLEGIGYSSRGFIGVTIDY